MKEFTLNMLSHADKVKGQGVLSAYLEELQLIEGNLNCIDGKDSDFTMRVTVNSSQAADITHIHTVNPQFFMQIPYLKSKGVTVGSVHFLPETVDKSLNLPQVFREFFYDYLIQFYKSVDYLVTVNPCFIPKLAAYGIDSNKVTYIPNYVSGKQFFEVDRERKKELRKEYHLKEDVFTVVCAGQLQTRKGVMDFAEIAKTLPQMQFVWAGDFAFGNMSDGRKEIEGLLKNHPKNLYFTGLIEREKMPHIYQMGDVMLLPSFDELFPMTVLEAMSCGIPILLRDLELYPIILDGYYLKSDGVQGFVDELKKLSQQPQYYQQAVQMSQKGNTFYSEEHVLSMWRSFYHGLLEESQRRQQRKMIHKMRWLMAGGLR